MSQLDNGGRHEAERRAPEKCWSGQQFSGLDKRALLASVVLCMGRMDSSLSTPVSEGAESSRRLQPYLWGESCSLQIRQQESTLQNMARGTQI